VTRARAHDGTGSPAAFESGIQSVTSVTARSAAGARPAAPRRS
jgi:hypothetical protein